MKFAIIYLFLIVGISSCKKSIHTSVQEEVQKTKILTAAELPVNILNNPEFFFIKDAEYNPNMFAKFNVNSQQAETLERLLRSKRLLQMRWISSPPHEVKSWWNPDKDYLNISYMTKINAPVNILISPGNDNKIIYIWVSSP